MKNPLRKRIPRELRSDFAKYLVIFLFLVMLISLVSAFLVADGSVYKAMIDGYEKYNIEDGHFSVNHALPDSVKEELETRSRLTIYDLQYFEETISGTNKNVRVYKDRDIVNLECVMSGSMPQSDDEIAIDRMFAQNNGIEVGDEIVLNGRTLSVTAFIAVPDYSSLFEKNTDMMFDSINFTIAVMTKEGYEAFDSRHITYNYAWIYDEKLDYSDKQKSKELSDELIANATDIITAYDKEIVVNAYLKGITDAEQLETLILEVTDYVPAYQNAAINFTREDMGGDKAMFIVFDYIVIVILAFVFAVTTSNTITKEAGVIGTLRASGYTKGEVARHYIILPVLVSLLAAVIGNLLGYTVLKGVMVDLYYKSYSLCTYVTIWSGEAFILTTVIPIILMFVINLAVISSKLRLSPLRFLRHDLSKRGKKKAFRLNTRIPIMIRFRLRVLFQNISNYLTLSVGIFFAAIVAVFGLMFVPLLKDLSELVVNHRLCDYQYVLMGQYETEAIGAEKYALTSLEIEKTGYKADEVSVLGIVEDSSYIKTDIPKQKVLITNGIADKYGIAEGDTFTLIDPYSDKEYEFVVAGTYEYEATLQVYMNIDEFNALFEKNESYFTGYFSNVRIEDIDADNIATIITAEDLKKTSDQLLTSMGDFMSILQYFSIIMFILLMFILSKQIIEKNAGSIAMTKILGFTNGEIGGLYIVSTSIVVVLSLLLAVPLTDLALKAIFKNYLYKEVSGYVPYIISDACYVKMIVMGLVSYILVAVFQLVKISRIPKSDALKNVE